MKYPTYYFNKNFKNVAVVYFIIKYVNFTKAQIPTYFQLH